MRNPRVLAARIRTKLPRTRSSALFAAALLAGGVLGPLTGIAVGAGKGTVTTITVPAGCTTPTTTTPTVPVTTITTTPTVPVTTTTTTTITTANPASSPVDETVYVGQSVAFQIVVPGDTSPTLSYAANSSPPDGLTLNGATGLISGTVAADAAGSTMSVTVTDGGALVGSVEIVWTVDSSGGSGFGTTTTTTTTVPVTTTTTAPAGTVPACTTTTVTIPPTGPYVPPTNTAARPTAIGVPKNNPFADHAMWIWELPATDGGNVSRIIAQAKADKIGTLIIKSGDGITPWSQFSKALVNQIHAAKLKVCAWQYVYGNHPAQEAAVGALAKTDGANCLVIDAESQYEGRYVAAQTYIKDLRQRIGKSFAVGLAGLPYIQYHTSFPYSIFLGANGAQYNLPQMYWLDIGTTVPYVYQTTYEYNEIYRRPVFPLGQLYADSSGAPSASSIGQFNTLAKDYKATGVSWWDFQSATNAWLADTARTAAAPAHFKAATNAATLVKGNLGDIVIWAQEHLDGAGAKLSVDGDYGAATQTAVLAFQVTHKLPVTGTIDGRTWDALLKYKPVSVSWSTRGRTVYATITRAQQRLRSAVALRRGPGAAAAARVERSRAAIRRAAR